MAYGLAPRCRTRMMMKTLKRQELVTSLLEEIATGVHLENQKFLPRRRVEHLWSVSNRTAHTALGILVREGVLTRATRKTTLLAPGGIRKARALLSTLPNNPGLAIGGATALGRAKAKLASPSNRTPCKALLHEQLVKSLLLEIAGGGHRENQRFFSRRGIQRMWKVSGFTAEKAKSMLIAWGVLGRRNGKFDVLLPDAITRACLLLDKMPFAALRPPDTSKTKRNRIWHGRERMGGYRLALIHDGAHYDASILHGVAREMTVRELSDQLHKLRHLVAFIREANEYSCETLVFRDDGHPETASRLLDKIIAKRVEGAAIMELRRLPSADLLAEGMKRIGLTFVTGLDNFDGMADAAIECNETAAGHAAMKILLGHGHRDILLVNKNSRDEPFLSRRRDGAMACLANSGRLSKARIRYRVVSAKEGGGQSLRPVFGPNKSTWPTAVLLLDTRTLKAADEVLREAGAKIPKDLSLIACGPRGYKSSWIGSFDVIDRDRAVLGAETARQLIRMIYGQAVPKAVQLETPYLCRGTVGKPSSRRRRKPRSSS